MLKDTGNLILNKTQAALSLFKVLDLLSHYTVQSLKFHILAILEIKDGPLEEIAQPTRKRILNPHACVGLIELSARALASHGPIIACNCSNLLQS